MDKVQEFLREWTFQYLKNKDLTRGNIKDIKEKVSNIDLFVEFKNKKQVIVIEPELKDVKAILIRLNEAKNKLNAKHSAIVVLNNKQNLDSIKNSWENLIADSGLSLYFVNPLSVMQRIWIVFPSTHEKISDKDTLNSLFEAVEEIEYKEIAKRL